MNIEELIKDLPDSIYKDIEYAVSNYDFEEIFGDECKVITYSELSTYDSIDDLLYEREGILFIFILYEVKKNYGHWTLLINHQSYIEFFDPYGYKPDEELKFTNPDYRKKYNMDFPYLTFLLYESELPIQYNDRQLQKFEKGVNTCGRWCIVRCQFFDINVDKFADYFVNLNKKDRLNGDKLVTYLTNYLL